MFRQWKQQKRTKSFVLRNWTNNVFYGKLKQFKVHRNVLSRFLKTESHQKSCIKMPSKWFLALFFCKPEPPFAFFSHFFETFWSVLKAQPIKLIYAFGLTDDIGYHRTRRGTKEVNLLNYSPRMVASNSSDYFSVTVEKVWIIRHLSSTLTSLHWFSFLFQITIPAIHTYYHCKIMLLPPFSTKRHIYLVL